MEIELTKEQIEKIANVVRKDLRSSACKERPRHVILGVVCQPGGGKIVSDKEARFRAAGRDLNLLLTVRGDLNAIVNAMNAGDWKHAKRLAEWLLGHVDETIEEA